MLASVSVQAKDLFNYELPKGYYSYQGEYRVALVRRVQKVDHTTPEGQALKRSLTKKKYNCVRQTRQFTLCIQKWVPTETYPEFAPALNQVLGGLSLEFGEVYAEPSVTHDGTQREWRIDQKVIIDGGQAVHSYRFTEYNVEDKRPTVFVPGSQMQILRYEGADKLTGVLQLHYKESADITMGFVVEPFFTR